MFTRRRFLCLLPAFAVSAQAQTGWHVFRRKKPSAPPLPLTVYIGTDTSKGISKGIYQAHFDATHGQLTAPILAAATVRPSFFAITPIGLSQHFLYTVNETDDLTAAATTFAIESQTGALHQTGQVSSGGAGPAYISVDATGHSAFIADYAGASIASYRIQSDGT
ncbi:MAG: beta-propeller fold lactonase family protein, partial [Edaphobacter sp.]